MGKMRRPFGCNDSPATQTPTDERTFEYREDAQKYALQKMTGWVTFAQYIGAFDLWVIMASRKSWSKAPGIVRLDGSVR